MSGRFSDNPRPQLATDSQDGLLAAGDHARFAAPTTDANGWAVQYLPSGKRLWTLTHTWSAAAFGRAVVASLALPVGLATVGDGALTWGWYGTLAGGSPGSQLYRALLEMGDTSATIEVVEGTTSGVACNTVMATVWLNLTIVEG